MADFIPAVNTVKLALVSILASQKIVNVFHAKITADTLNATRAAHLADTLAAAWDTNLMPVFSNQMSLSHCEWVMLDTQTSPAGRTGEAGTPGAINHPSIPSNAALVITSRTALRGRSYRGRTYVAGIPNNFLSNAVTVDPTYANDLVAGFQLLQDAMTAEDAPLHVVSYQHNGVRTTPAHVELITHFTTDYYLDSQRRRLQGRGR
jgi:hypothetical protein